MNKEMILNEMNAPDVFEKYFITKGEVEEIKLSLTCSLTDYRTSLYARGTFPKFYENMTREYKMFRDAISECDMPEYLTLTEKTIVMMEDAYKAFKERMENMEFNE